MRMRISRATIAAAIAALGMWTAGTAARVVGAPPGKSDRRIEGVLTDKEAFLFAGTEMIAGPQVTRIAPAPEGRYLLALRERVDIDPALPLMTQQPMREHSLVLWNSRTRRSSVIWKHTEDSASDAQVGQVEWLPGTTSALLQIGAMQTDASGMPHSRMQLFFLDAARASLRPIAELADGESFLFQLYLLLHLLYAFLQASLPAFAFLSLY